MTVSKRWFVTGQVQGVGFRAFVVELARNEGVAGYVRNLADGRVETTAAGDDEAMTRFEQGLRAGPPLARVQALVAEDADTSDMPREFLVRPSKLSR